MTQPYAEWVADRYCGRKRHQAGRKRCGARALVTRPVGVGVPVPPVQRVAPYDRPDHEGGGMNGVWVIAGSALADQYPCLCRGSRPCGRRCPCRGRTDVDGLPGVCCARRDKETKGRVERDG